MASSSNSSSSSVLSNSSGTTVLYGSTVISVGGTNIAFGSPSVMEGSSLISRAHYSELVLKEEITSGPGYGLHKAQGDRKLVLVKVFGGPLKNEHIKKNVDAQTRYEGYWHPNIACFSNVINDGPRLYQVYPQLDPNSPCDLLEHIIAKELKIGLAESIIISLKTVVGIARAISFLSQAGFPLIEACSKVDECFDVVSGSDKNPLLVIHVERLDTVVDLDAEPSAGQAPADWVVFNTLCSKIFKKVNVKLYSDLPLVQHERSPHLSTTPRVDAAYSEFVDPQLSPALSSSMSRTRRELSWVAGLTEIPSSLRDIADTLNSILKVPPTPTLLPYKEGARSGIVHGCSQYLREEIILTARAGGCAVVAYDSPRIMEICFVCGERCVGL